MFYCYILKSINSGKYYIGSTENFQKRLIIHNLGRVKSTKHDKPWILVKLENFQSLREARKRELQIKNWKSREAIEKLFKTPGF